MCKRNVLLKYARLSLLALLVGGGAQSAGAVDMQFSGTLISAPKCTLSTSDVIVEFGDLDIAKLTTAGGNYDQVRVWYDPKCTNTQDASKFTVNLIFQGTPAVGNAQALSTNNAGLGILLKDQGGRVLEVNSPFLVKDLAFVPSIWAYPIKLNENVAGGTFKASGTLIFDIK
ncbi:fimbrial protein [Pseudomonas sp. SDM007_2]|nr:fimbrial protein [Pseudomonas hygromyciniae]